MPKPLQHMHILSTQLMLSWRLMMSSSAFSRLSRLIYRHDTSLSHVTLSPQSDLNCRKRSSMHKANKHCHTVSDLEQACTHAPRFLDIGLLRLWSVPRVHADSAAAAAADAARILIQYSVSVCLSVQDSWPQFLFTVCIC